MDRATQELTTSILKSAVLVVVIMVGTYLLLVGGRHLRPGCFGFVAHCGAGDAEAIERCVGEQYAAGCPLSLRLAWLVVWLAYCAGSVWLIMKKELMQRWAPERQP